ncbi:hypothetical protein RHO14_07000 [Orbus wheelerorum]|uniref:hypothetical protein n=1 Tax=Orbus wheelerorum TaxID=3074111 RepID=UPI00370D174A
MISFKTLVPIFALILAFGFGYYVRDLQQNKTILKQERAQQEAINKKIEVSSKHANTLEKQLQQVKQHEQTITSTAIQATKGDRVNSDHACVDDDFIKLYNQQSKKYQRILSGQHATAVPDNVARP